MAKLKQEIGQKAIAELLATFDPENPRIHTLETDLESLALRLLHNGWQKIPTWNTKLKKLVGGHGRIQACEWLIQQNKEWFSDRWIEWLTENQSKYSDAEIRTSHERYASGYWLSIPVLLVSLDAKTHKIALLALNHAEGQDDRLIIAKLIANMGKLHTESAGFSESERDRFLAQFKMKSAFAKQKQESENRELLGEVDMEAIALKTQQELVRQEWLQKLEQEEDEDRDVGEGGANFNADPPVGERKPTVYPLCVTLSDRRFKQLQELKEKLKVKQDMTILLKLHPCFAENLESSNASP